MMRLRARLAAVPWPRLETWKGRPFFPVSSSRLLLGSGAAILIGLWVLAHVWYDCRALLVFDDHMGDGPFQLFNPLRRIAAGQTGGVEFQYFHGLGLPYLHYPVYSLLGGGLFASEVARYAISETAYLLAFVAVFGLATRRLVPTLVLTAAALVFYERIGYDSLALPGVNLPGLRSTCPLLVLGVLLSRWRPGREAVAAGALTGIGFSLGTDHGIATAAMLGVVWLGRAVMGLPGGSLRHLLIMIASSVGAAAVILLAIGGSAGATAAVRYALVELPADQFWFFGVPPNRFLHLRDQFLSERLLVPALVLPASFGLALISWMRHHPASRPVAIVLLGAMAYAMLSCVGYFGYCSAHYLNPAIRMHVVAGLIVAWHVIPWVSRLPEVGPAIDRAARWVLAGFLATFILIGPTTTGRCSAIESFAAAREVAAWAREVQASRCPLGPRFQTHLGTLTQAIDRDRAAAGITRPPVIWSTYAGILEAHYGVFHPAEDYLIHALGPRREGYVAAFRRTKPDYVCTFRRSVWPWEECLQNNCWSFYEELVLNYEPLADSWAYRLWKRRPGEWQSPDSNVGRVSIAPERPDLFRVPVPPDLSPGAGLVVEIEYETKVPGRGVPVLGGLPRFLAHPHDCENQTPISLPPGRDRWAFVVYPIAGKTPSFFVGEASLTGGRVKVTAVHVRPIRADGRERFLHDEPLAKLH